MIYIDIYIYKLYNIIYTCVYGKLLTWNDAKIWVFLEVQDLESTGVQLP